MGATNRLVLYGDAQQIYSGTSVGSRDGFMQYALVFEIMINCSLLEVQVLSTSWLALFQAVPKSGGIVSIRLKASAQVSI